MRILLSAFACEPGRGSEPGIGWAWAEALARDHDVVVLTDASHKTAIEAELAIRPRPRLRVEYLGSGATVWRGPRIYRYYYQWQRMALARARELHRYAAFDVVHAVTYTAHRLPSYMGRLGIPFIWGPLGGGEDVSLAFYHPRWIGARESAKELVRWLWNRWCRVDPGRRAAARLARAIAVTTQQTLSTFPLDVHGRIILLPSSVLNRSDQMAISASRATAGPRSGLSLAFAGHLVGWKGPSFALRAFAMYARRYPTAELRFYGDGPMRGSLGALAGELGVSSRVHFHGWLPRAEMLATYAQHHVFLFPSLHDSSGFVAIEAQAAGLPVVCLDTGGPGMTVATGAGVKVPPTTPRRVVADLARGLAWLTDDPSRWMAASEIARAHALDPAATPTIDEMIARLYGAAGLLPER